MDCYYDLGSHGRQVTTSSAEAQRWFDRGLVWCYGYCRPARISGGRGRGNGAIALEDTPGRRNIITDMVRGTGLC